MARKRYKPAAQKEKKNWGAIIVLVFLVIGLSSSFLFFGFRDEGTSQSYNGYDFTYRQDAWHVEVDDTEYQFLLTPDQVNTIRLPDEVKRLLDNPVQLDTTSNVSDEYNQSIALAQYQMAFTLRDAGVYSRTGFITNVSSRFPVITCADASPTVPVIYYQGANLTGVSSEEGCILAKGQSQTDIIRIKDRLMYQLLGVME